MAVAVLRAGGLVVYPTDTLYGLGARADDVAAVRRIFDLKARPVDQALPLLIGDLAQIEWVTDVVTPLAREFMARFWPGALTLILPRGDNVPGAVTGGGDTVAVRLPGHAVSRALAQRAGVPLVGTSANLSGQPAALTAPEARSQLGARVDIFIDGGRAPGGIESTVLDLTVSPPRVVRPGAVTVASLREVSPDII